MKNLLKLSCLLTILFAFNSFTFAQQQWGVKASGGISRIYGELGADNFSWYPTSIPPTSSSFSPSFQAGLYYLLPTGKNTSLGAELLYSNVQGGQTATWDHYFNDILVDYSTISTNEHISWLSLPVYFGVTFNRLTINAGVQLSYLLSSSGNVKTNTTQIPVEPVSDDTPRVLYGNWSRDINNLSIKDMEFGPRAGVVYRLTNNLSMEGTFYYGLNNINLRPSSEKELKVQQMILGVRYDLAPKKSVGTATFGSREFGIKAGGGVSKTTNSLDQIQITSPIGMTERYQFSTPCMTSGQGGFYYNVQIGRYSYLGAELLFSQIDGNEKMEENIKGKINNVNGESLSYTIGPYSDDIHIENNNIRHVSYLSLPLYYGYKIKKWSINAGLQVNYALLIRESYQRNITVNGEPYNTYNKKLDISTVNLDFGPRVGIIYQLSNKLAVEANYYYGLNDIRIREEYGITGELKVQQMTVGIRYALWNKKATE